MLDILPVLLIDGYKVGHPFQYPKKTTKVYSNFTPRGSRVRGVPGLVHAGLQFFEQEYLINQFNERFFQRSREEVLRRYKRRIDSYLGPGIPVNHIGELHELGYLPLRIKSLPEGTLVPFRVPLWTAVNTLDDFAWVTNMLETLESNVLWHPSTSATTAFMYRLMGEKFAKETGADPGFVKYQFHDFSMRGIAGIEAAALSGMAHLIFFYGTDTLCAIDLIEQFYGGDCEREIIGRSVHATEHSVMCMGLQAGERETIKRLITEVYPKDIVSIVSDTWDFWYVVTSIYPSLKDIIMQRNGKVVIRPDSGDPVLILCGDPSSSIPHVRDGLIETLWKQFGGTVVDGFKQLDPHIGAIYGDSITPDRAWTIFTRLAAKGFASSNVVLGIGSFTYQFVTRDTFGLAMKATYGEIDHVGQNISKAPKTDNGVKNSACGLLQVTSDLQLQEECTWAEEAEGLLEETFCDSVMVKTTTFEQVRARAEVYLNIELDKVMEQLA